MIPRAEAVVAVAIVLVLCAIAVLAIFEPASALQVAAIIGSLVTPLVGILGFVVRGLVGSTSNPTQPPTAAKE